MTSTDTQINSVMDHAYKLMEKVVHNLGPVGSHVWEVIVRQSYITAISDIVEDTALIALAVLSTYGFIKAWRSGFFHESSGKYVAFHIMFFSIGFIALWMIALITVSYDISEIITGLTNPEYPAIKTLLGK